MNVLRHVDGSAPVRKSGRLASKHARARLRRRWARLVGKNERRARTLADETRAKKKYRACFLDGKLGAGSQTVHRERRSTTDV